MKRLDVEPMNQGYEDVVQDMDQEEQDAALREQAAPILEGIIAAAQNVAEETKDIMLTRNGKAYFKLTIRPLPDALAKKLRKQCTKYSKSKSYGVKVPEETDTTKYHSLLVYEATVNKDETWDNKELWRALESRYPIVQGWETVDQVLLAGEKDRIVDEINALSGYSDEEDDEENLEETVKN